MKSIRRDLVVIGGGPAGIAAAISARRHGCRDVLLIERAEGLGGILNQCIHDGFGLHRFGEALSGPEYAQRFIDQLDRLQIESMCGTSVLSLSNTRTLQISSKKGFFEIRAGAVILAMGCRERTAGAISLPGTRPAGVYTAGAAQNLINLQNIMPGRKAVILGSGDIGMIMARRMVLEGATVEGVFEMLPYAGGLQRNIHQCLTDFQIPLHLGTTVTCVHGKRRVESVTVARVDAQRRPMADTHRLIPCDTLLLSIGLIPENELTRQARIPIVPRTGGAMVDDRLMTAIPGIFACGNVLHVHDLVDYVSDEAESAGANAALYLEGGLPLTGAGIPIIPDAGIGYALPQKVSGRSDFTLSLRVSTPNRNRHVWVCTDKGRPVARKKMVRLHPTEMIRLRISAAKLAGAGALKVGVE